ncbi:MAG: D-ornithine 4,5-aminomutase subunit OraS [Deltaproteobacteria bacterium]|nr:D-ornithine 4,5-aminomutase subunit OraS [Deltaproteobacteria bacterium]
MVEPLINMAKTNTSPSVERSVLLRMGFSSIDAGKIITELSKRNLLGHGAGNAVWKLSKKLDYGGYG